MGYRKPEKRLIKTIGIVLNQELLEKIQDISKIEYEDNNSFSFVVRKLLEKGIKLTLIERKEKEEMIKIYKNHKKSNLVESY